MARIRSFQWTPDPMVFADSTNAVAQALQSKIRPLTESSIVAQQDIRERFDTETDPHGNKWQEWSPNYAPVALGETPGKGGQFPNIGILQRTGELADVASSSQAIRISNDTVFYETHQLPNYGLLHETGNPETNLPQRQFLGLSEEANVAIFAAWADWFDGAVDMFVSPSGKLSFRHAIQGPGGFVSRASVGRAPRIGF